MNTYVSPTDKIRIETYAVLLRYFPEDVAAAILTPSCEWARKPAQLRHPPDIGADVPGGGAV